MTIQEEYLYYQNKYEKTYGKTIVLMQVGSFHECYALEEKGPDLQKISELCDLTLTKKNKNKPLSISNPYLLGFPTVALDKYIKKLVQEGYTVPVIDQVSPPPEPKREITGIYSPGTYIEETNSIDSNNIMSIYIEDEQQLDKSYIICIGVSVADVSTGRVTIYEIISHKTDRTLACDEAVRFINSYFPKEIVVNRKNILKADKDKIQSKEDIINYLELNDKNYNFTNSIDKKWYKQPYKETFLKKVYNTTGIYDTVIEYLDLEKKPYCLMSLLFLLNFIYQHNPNLLKEIRKPEYFNGDQHLILGNNAISQLNIVRSEISNNTCSKFKSLFDVVNNTKTPMGRRFLKTRLCNPITSKEKLENTYNIISNIKDKYLDEIETKILGIVDVERLYRRINIGSIHPHELNEFVKSYKKIQQLFNFIQKKKDINIDIKKINDKLKEFIKYADSTFDFDKLQILKINDIDTTLFKKGKFSSIDDIQTKIDSNLDFLIDLQAILSSYIKDKSKKEDKTKVKLENNKNDGYFFRTTKLRAKSLKKELEKIKDITVKDKTITFSSLTFKDLKGGNTKITSDIIETVSDSIISLTESISNVVLEQYRKELVNISNTYNILFRDLTDCISFIDFCYSAAKTASIYNYTKPIIKEKNFGYIKTSNLRHPIIERLTQTEYIPHDIEIGTKTKNSIDGMLIFGLNSAGKSSLMKATGLSIVLAQSGLFVPAESYEFSPFSSLFARITGNDNIFKGLSSFALEMVELGAILKRISKKTLVIGDEVCRGTETISGNAIVASTIVELSKSKTPFMFATHLHKVPEIEEVKNLKNVKSFHLTVETDTKSGKLIFDRKLKPGPGENMYGIKVAKHIIDSSEFIKRAESIRNKLIDKQELVVTDKTSNYNSKLIMDCCQVCGKTIKNKYEIPLDTHHINYQQDCENGFVKSKPHLQMNSIANLVVLCKKCHTNEHKGKIKIKGYTKTTSGIELDIKYL